MTARTMRKPSTIESLYLDFDGFFAAVEEQARPALRGYPIGVTPFENTRHTCVIAANYKAKAKGVKVGMPTADALKICPTIKFVPQSPDLYERAHRKLLMVIEGEIPIQTVCSIDELHCKLDPQDIDDPEGLSERIKASICEKVGPYITCSIGMAPNAQLAKIASDMDKPNGLTILKPEELPGRLLDLALDDVPGIGRRMKTRLLDAGIWSVDRLWEAQPKQLRALWGNVMGERFWYALHGYEIQAEMTERSMFGHGRVLPPDWRDFEHAFEASRLLTVKAARRLRRAGYVANSFGLRLRSKDHKWGGSEWIGASNDDAAGILALSKLLKRAQSELPQNLRITQVYVFFYDVSPEGSRQEDMFQMQDIQRAKWVHLSQTMDEMNSKYAKTLVSLGVWKQPPGGYAGGKIAFSRVPDAEDFW